MGNSNKKSTKVCSTPKHITTIGIPRNLNDLSPRAYFMLNKKLPENIDGNNYLMENLIGLDTHLYDIKEQMIELERRLTHTEQKVHILQKFIH